MISIVEDRPYYDPKIKLHNKVTNLFSWEKNKSCERVFSLSLLLLSDYFF